MKVTIDQAEQNQNFWFKLYKTQNNNKLKWCTGYKWACYKMFLREVNNKI